MTEPPREDDRATGRLAPGESPATGGMALPERIGAYRPIEVLGSGGMGVVYLAEQQEPVRRRVALKLVKPGMDTEQVLARFDAERQALAMMSHAGIAKVFDGGATDSGRPYFVMEYAPGLPIDRYCDRARLGLRERLELFLEVCDAVQHAHQRGIIHRDLKPGNILVGDHDGRPVPKVIDFGVARATHERLTDRTLLTEFGQMVGTPEYMSPEQCEGSGADVDTRADVYALGVVLYEVLCGVLPVDSRVLRAMGLADLQRAIREQDTPRPSTRIRTLGERATEIAGARKLTVEELARALAGEVEWIPLKALRKEREQRYASVAEMAADVRNYLTGRPLVAGPESLSYRAGKFLRRHRAPVAAACAFLVLLVGSVIGLAILARRALAEKANAEFARDRAEATSTFVIDTLAGVGPSVALGRDTTMLREMMDRAAERIDRGELRANAESEIALRRLIGETYRELGQLDAAERMLVPGLELARQNYGNDHAWVASLLTNLAALARGRGDAEGAVARAAEAVELARRVPAADEILAPALNIAGRLHLDRNELDPALALSEEALAVWRRVEAGDHENVATGLNNVATVRQARGDLAGAEAALREALEMGRRLHAGGHPNTALRLENLGTLRGDAGALEEGEALLRESLEMWRTLLPGDHEQVARALSNLAANLLRQQRLAESEPLFREALAMQRRLLPQEHPNIAVAVNNLASVLRGQGKFAEAEPLFREALGSHRARLPAGHPLIAITMANLAGVIRDQGRPADAEPLASEAATLAATALPAARSERWRLASEYGLTLLRLGRWTEAERVLAEAEAGLNAAANRREDWLRDNAERLAQARNRSRR